MLVYQKSLLLVIVPFVTQLLFIAVLSLALRNGETSIDRQFNRTKVANATRMLVARAHKDLVKNGDAFVGVEFVSKAEPEEANALLSEIRGSLGADYRKEMLELDNEWQKTESFAGEVSRLVTRKGLSKRQEQGLLCVAALRLSALSRACRSVNAAMEKMVLQEREVTAKYYLDNWLLPGIFVSVAVTILLSVFLNVDLARSIRRLCENCRRMGEGKDLLPPMTGQDELASLDRALHRVDNALRSTLNREKAVQDNATNAILTVDSEYRIVASNPAWARLSRILSSRGDNDLQQLFELDKVEVFREALDGLRATESKSTTFEMPCLDSKETILNLLWSVSWDPSRALYFCVAHDVTDQKEAEGRRQEFVAMLTHDLRSPLTSVGIALEMCMASNAMLSPELSTSLRLQKDRVQTVVSKINSLLDLERLEGNHMDLDCVTVDVNLLFDGLTHAMQEPHQKIVNVIEEQLSIHADPDRVWQLLCCVLKNAVEHSPVGEPIVLSAQAHDQWVEISVKDKGPGIPTQLLVEIFDRYKSPSADENDLQTGLGLPLCKAIVEAHGGEIGIESSSEYGTNVWIKLKRSEKEIAL